MSCRSTSREDVATERRILATILDGYPELYTEGELTWMYVRDLDDFGERDAVARALDGLTAVGLLHNFGPLVIPTVAALRIKAMEDDEAA